MPRARSLAARQRPCSEAEIAFDGEFSFPPRRPIRLGRCTNTLVPFLGLRKRQCRPSAYRDEQVRLEFSVAIGGAAEMGEGAA